MIIIKIAKNTIIKKNIQLYIPRMMKIQQMKTMI